MYDIKQITNFNIPSTAPITIERIVIEGDIDPETHMPKTRQVYYKNITNNTIMQGVEKIGYCCEPKAKQYPIFLSFDNGIRNKEFYIGKTGMYEVQPEEWNENEIKVRINEVKVPWKWIEEPNPNQYGYNFKFDYAYNSTE